MNRIMMNRPIFKHIPQAHSHMRKQYNRHRHVGANILKTEQGFDIQLAVPGIDKSLLEIYVEGDMLNIQMRANKEEGTQDYKLKQFDYSNFKKRFELSEDIDKDHIEANYKDGILSIKLIKTELSEDEHIRKIEIN